MVRIIAATKQHEHKFAVTAEIEGFHVFPSPPWGDTTFTGFTSEAFWVGPCPTCGKRLRLEVHEVRGRYSSRKKCDPRCTDARGHNCECQCAGKRHGEAWR